MLKSTNNPMTREQFTKLREARRLIKQQFSSEFSLHSEEVIRDLYDFALRSETNELFVLFSELNEISGEALEQPLNQEQFIMLREAKGLVEAEFGEELPLIASNVMDKLYEFSLQSVGEELFDVYVYLSSRADEPDVPITKISGTRFRKLREAKRLVSTQFDRNVTLHSDTAMDTLVSFAQRTDDPTLVDTVDWLSNWRPNTQIALELLFHELSATDFERLREAKVQIRDEFGDEFSLHAETALADLYGFALRSDSVALFDLFYDLLGPQMARRNAADTPGDWLSKEQFMLLRSAREAIRDEFGATLQLESATVQDDLYQFALRAAEEQLFDLCWEFQQLHAPMTGESSLPYKEEFRMLRLARSLVNEEFSEELQLQSDVVETDLYKYAVSSDTDDLFDLYTELMALPSKSTSISEPTTPTLTKEEFVSLRVARRLILTEFGEHLALESADVLDQLYSFALASEDDQLFDLHATLNAKAVHESVKPEIETKVDTVMPDNATTEVVHESETKAGLKKVFSLLGSFANTGKANDESPPTAQHDASASPAELEGEETTNATTVKEPGSAAARETKTADPAPPHTSFPDLIVRAIEQAPKGTLRKDSPDRLDKVTPVLVRDVTIPEADEAHGVADAAENRSSAKEKAANDGNASESEKSWYVSTHDGRLRVRLTSQLSVGMDGGLVVGAPSGDPSQAIIEVVADKPVIFVQDDELLVNNHPVKDKYELASGDAIAVAGSQFQVEYAAQDPTSDDATASAGQNI